MLLNGVWSVKGKDEKGKVIEFKDVQYAKAWCEILVIVLGILIVVKLSQLWNVFESIEVIVFGSVIELNPLHLLKAFFSIFVIVFGIVIFVIYTQLSKAKLPIVVTV